MTSREIQDGGGGLAGALARVAFSVLAVPYGLAVRARAAAYSSGLLRARALPRPVVSVGNLTAGGTGKTPFVAWLASRLVAAGRRPGILSRGYGPRPEGSDLSDEGVLLRDLLGTGVPQVEDPDRVRAGETLLAREPAVDVLLLDDGFQHRRLARDLDVVLLDATDPFGGGRLLPRGRLREPRSALCRAHAIVLTRSDLVESAALEAVRREARRLAPAASLALARTVPRALVGVGGAERGVADLRGARVAVSAGIGNPAAFRRTLEALGAEVVASRALRDHHRPGVDEPERVERLARESGADLVVVTRKDWVKLRSIPGLPDRVVALDAATEVGEGGDDLLQRVLDLRAPVPD